MVLGRAPNGVVETHIVYLQLWLCRSAQLLNWNFSIKFPPHDQM